jgi:N6-adenosine-specific RNA methylase IME4
VETNEKILIDAEFASLIPPLGEEERAGLERALLSDGCRDPLTVWRQEGREPVLLDGHNRLELCLRHNLSYALKSVELATRKEAKRWILQNQLDRRNLNESQRALVAAQIATLPANRPGRGSAQICALPQSRAAAQHEVSRRLVQHARKVLTDGSPSLRDAVMHGVIPVSLGSIITGLPKDEQDRVAQRCLEHHDAKAARTAAQELRLRQPAPGENRAAAKMLDLDGLPDFAFVFADPFRCQPGSACENHHNTTDRQYPALSADVVKAVGGELGTHLSPDAALLLWVPGPLLERGLTLIKTWGFKFRAHGVLVLDVGVGPRDFIVYDHHVLLIATKGVSSWPPQASGQSSIIDEEAAYKTIECLGPDSPRLAPFARVHRPGWSWWDGIAGNAVETAAAATPAKDEVDLE